MWFLMHLHVVSKIEHDVLHIGVIEGQKTGEIENERYSPSTLELPIDLETETTEIETGKGKNEKKRKVRLQSDVWDHFTMIEGGDPMDPRAACNYCGKDYAADHKKHGTSSLWNHYNHHCKRNLNKGDQVDDLVNVQLSEEACRHACCKVHSFGGVAI